MQRQRASREFEVARLASRQHGVVGYRQLIELGVGPGAIAHRVRVGLLHRLHRGVYAVGHTAVSGEGWDMAAVLACGGAALLSHWSAAVRWRLLERRTAVRSVTVEGHRRSQRGIRVHCVRAFDPDDCALQDGIPVTSVPRTLLDLAAVATTKVLMRALNEADRRGRLNRRAVIELCARNGGTRGVKRLRAALASISAGTRRTRSDLEAEFLRLCRRQELPRPAVNVRIAGYEVDMHWPGTGLIVELDGYEFHRTRVAFERDRRRDADLAKRGYHVIRVTYEWLTGDPAGVAAAVRALLHTPPPVQTVSA